MDQNLVSELQRVYNKVGHGGYPSYKIMEEGWTKSARKSWDATGRCLHCSQRRSSEHRFTVMMNLLQTICASQHLVLIDQCAFAGDTLTGSFSCYDVLGFAGNAPTGSSNLSKNELPLRLI